MRTLFKVRCGSVDMFDDFVCGDVALYYIIIQRGVSAFKSPALTAINVVDKIIDAPGGIMQYNSMATQTAECPPFITIMNYLGCLVVLDCISFLSAIVVPHLSQFAKHLNG